MTLWNCFNHTQEPAVAQCSDCGKGLCSECAERYQPILCTPCFQKRKRSEIWRSIFSLLFLIALFVIGFKWNFLATKGVEDMRWMSGYVLMAIWSGYLFVEKYIPYKMMAGTNGAVDCLLYCQTAPLCRHRSLHHTFHLLVGSVQGNKGFSVRGGKNKHL